MAANFIDLARTSVEQGLLFGLVALALTLTFRVVRFPDLTVDGSFVTGASVFSAGAFYYHAPWLAIPCAFIAGMLAGLTTGVLSSTLRINRLLSGILVMTMLYSINLRIMRQGNLSLAGVPTPLDQMDEWLGSTSYASIAILGFLALASALLIGAPRHRGWAVLPSDRPESAPCRDTWTKARVFCYCFACHLQWTDRTRWCFCGSRVRIR